uniref:RanBP2-type domain-containing protein n=1 Tax=Emiliania huxleyi TaxID=2903 RepID=A0A7S3RZ30_EMIHU
MEFDQRHAHNGACQGGEVGKTLEQLLANSGDVHLLSKSLPPAEVKPPPLPLPCFSSGGIDAASSRSSSDLTSHAAPSSTGTSGFLNLPSVSPQSSLGAPPVLPLPPGALPGALPGAMLPGVLPPRAGAGSPEQWSEEQQQAKEDQEFLGALAYLTIDGQPRDAASPLAPGSEEPPRGSCGANGTQASQQQAQMEALMLSQEVASQKAQAQQAQIEAERMALTEAASVAERQRAEAEATIAVQQARLAELNALTQQAQHVGRPQPPLPLGAAPADALQLQQQGQPSPPAAGGPFAAPPAPPLGQQFSAGGGAVAPQFPHYPMATCNPCDTACAPCACNGVMGAQSLGGAQPPLPPQSFPPGPLAPYMAGQGADPGWRGQQQQRINNGPPPNAMQQMAPPLPSMPPPMQQQPVVCEFCGRWLSEMALDQGNHMCDEFWAYNAEFQSTGSKCALLVGGVQHLKVEHLNSFAARFPSTRRVRHGASFAEFNGLFVLGDEQTQTQALRLLMNCGVRTIPLGHAAMWRCLHVQLAPGNSPQRVGQAEQILQNQLLRAMEQNRNSDGSGSNQATGALAPPMGLGGMGRGKAAADAWALRAKEAKRRADPAAQQQMSAQQRFLQGPPLPPGGNGPGSAPGDWKCPNCGNINFAFREKCNRCNMPRPGAKLYGPMAAAERRICPYTVMLMRVPSHASEPQVAEALLVFGEVAPGGIKFHRQGAKFKQQRRGRIPPEGLALHAFCRFVRPASASAALQQGEIFILGQSVQINPAFMRGALPPEMSGGVGMPPMPPMPPLPHEQQGGGDWGRPPAPGGFQNGGGGFSNGGGGGFPNGLCAGGPGGQSWPGAIGNLLDEHDGQGREMMPSVAPMADGESKVGELPSFLAVLFQALWFLEPFRQQVGAMPRGNDPIVNGVQMLRSSLFGQRTAAPLALLRAALAPRIIETARAQICSVGDASECFEAALSVLSEANDQRFVSCLEQHFRMGIMEMCECTCGELLEPMSYKQCATYVSVPTVLMREGTSLTSQLATVVGPGCPVANCGSRMHIQRYLMQPMPSVITVALVWDAAVASDVGAVLQRVELQLEVHRAFKGITSNVQASLRGMMCKNGAPRPAEAFLGGWRTSRDVSTTSLVRHQALRVLPRRNAANLAGASRRCLHPSLPVQRLPRPHPPLPAQRLSRPRRCG